MADDGSIDDLLGSEVDENAVVAMVGNLEYQLASPTSKEPPKSLSEPSVNNNHINSPVPCNASTTLISPTTFSNSKGLSHHNSTLNSNVLPSSKNNSSDAQILGISSIINSSSTPVSGANGSGLSLLNVNTLAMTRGTAENVIQKSQNAPSLRVVTQPALVRISTANPATYVNSDGSSSMSVGTVHTATSHSAQTAHASTGTPVALGGNSNNNNSNFAVAIASVDQDAVTASQNGSIHSQAEAKSGTVIASRAQPPFVLKQEPGAGGTITIKSDGTAPSFILKQDSSGLKPEGTFTVPNVHGTNVVSTPQSGNLHVVQTTMKGVQGLSNPSVITVRTANQQGGGAVLRSPSGAVISGSMQIVHVTTGSGMTSRPTIVSQAKPGQTRVTAPTRIAQQPTQVTIAPRQTTAVGGQTLHNVQIGPGGLQLPPGSVLIKNEQGHLMVVPSQNLLNPTVATSSTAPKVQPIRPQGLTVAGQQRLPTGAPAIVTIQQQGAKGGRLQTAMLPQGAGLTQVTVPSTGGVASVQAVSAASMAQPQPALPGMAVTGTPANVHTTKQIVENVQKCKNFLSTLIKLASSQPAETVRNVRELIQGLIDGHVEPEAFTHKLQIELKSSPQPYLVPFLKKSLPLLRTSLIQKKMTIDGVRPPPPEVVQTPIQPSPVTLAAAVQQQRPIAALPQPVQVGRGGATAGILERVGNLIQLHKGGDVKVTVLQNNNAKRSRFVDYPPSMDHYPWSWDYGRDQEYQNSLKSVPPWQQPLAAKLPMQTLRLAGPNKVVMPVNKARVTMAATPATVSALQAHAAAKADTAHSRPEKRKYESLKDDDDINDVATMGGVNLSEESKNILATNAEHIGVQIRSCKDETFLSHGPLLSKINAIARKRGLEDCSGDVANIISHATQERLRDMLERLAAIAEHRLEHYKLDSRYEQTKDVKSQLKFLEELDKLENKRHREQEREILLRAIKSRSKSEDPEQAKLKQKAKELQLFEQEQNRQKAANETAMLAIGPRKKRKLDAGDGGHGLGSGSSGLSNGIGSSGQSSIPYRPRIKRVNAKDVVLLMEQEKSTTKSNLLYKTFLK